MKTFKAHSSHGVITADIETGRVCEVDLSPEFGEAPTRLNIEEWQQRYPNEGLKGEHDILDFGFWFGPEHAYETPCETWRIERERLRKER